VAAYKQREKKCPTELSSIRSGLKCQLTKMSSTGGFTSVVRGGTPQIIIDTYLHTYVYID